MRKQSETCLQSWHIYEDEIQLTTYAHDSIAVYRNRTLITRIRADEVTEIALSDGSRAIIARRDQRWVLMLGATHELMLRDAHEIHAVEKDWFTQPKQRGRVISIQIQIPEVSLKMHHAKLVGMYRLHTKMKLANGKEMKTTVCRRYSEFAELDASVRALFKGSLFHLKSSMPILPKKHTFRRHKSNSRFLIARRIELEAYLCRFVGIQQAIYSSKFQEFIEMDFVHGRVFPEQLNWYQAPERVNLSARISYIPFNYSPQEIPVTFYEDGPLGLDMIVSRDHVHLPKYAIIRSIKSAGVHPENYTTVSLYCSSCVYSLWLQVIYTV